MFGCEKKLAQATQSENNSLKRQVAWRAKSLRQDRRGHRGRRAVLSLIRVSILPARSHVCFRTTYSTLNSGLALSGCGSLAINLAVCHQLHFLRSTSNRRNHVIRQIFPQSLRSSLVMTVSFPAVFPFCFTMYSTSRFSPSTRSILEDHHGFDHSLLRLSVAQSRPPLFAAPLALPDARSS